MAFCPRSEEKHDFIDCMPLTEKTNRNHVDADGNIDCDTTVVCALTADDVANGICHYDSTGRALQEATNDQIEFFGAGDEPFRELCAHWSKETHYVNGICETSLCSPR